MAPFALVAELGKPGAYAVYLLIGIAFGATLEAAGFANSRKLAAQFYLRDMTVLKVMFTGIITAMVLIFLASAVGLLNYNGLYVPPTYLWPGIVGGLIMGVGFILGGFCPGTSIVALASLKIDGLFFFLGLMAGVFVFGETVGLFAGFWYSSYLGRFILPEWLGISTGAVVLLVVLMALGAFWAAEKAEAAFGGGPRDSSAMRPLMRLSGAAGLTVLAVVVMGMGQPSPADKWERVADEYTPLLESRQVQVEPGEFISVAANNQIRLALLDVRSETDFNLFHLVDSRRVPLEEIARGAVTTELLEQPANTLFMLVSNDEVDATEAWKLLVAEGVPNVYLLEGGINEWLDRFAGEGACEDCHARDGDVPVGALRYRFDAALGADRPIADPDTFRDLALPFTAKVKLEVRTELKGGCG
jgi:rhodanese-related sulfurtransferase